MKSARFSRRARLSKKAEYHRVFENSVKSVDSYFTVLARPNSLGFPRLGLAISRKAAKSAVARNRIKRIVRESFRHYQHEFGGIDFVVIGRTNLSGCANMAVFDSLRRHWSRLVRQCAKF